MIGVRASQQSSTVPPLGTGWWCSPAGMCSRSQFSRGTRGPGRGFGQNKHTSAYVQLAKTQTDRFLQNKNPSLSIGKMSFGGRRLCPLARLGV